jgi:Mg2+/Co2+ transporter CorB
MDTHMLLLFVIFVLLVLSALFSASETSLTAASRPRMHQLAKSGNRRAGIVNRLRQQSDSLISAILLGNNLVNILATALMTTLMTILFNERGVIYATIIMTVVVLIFAEVLPKSYAILYADRLALIVAPIMRGWIWLSWPLTWTIRRFSHLFFKLFRIETSNQLGSFLSDDDLRGAIDLHKSDADDTRSERAMLRGILDLDDVSVDRVMTHRKNIVMLEATRPVQELVDEVLASPFSRIPLWKDDPSNIIGVLHVKALVREIRRFTAESLDQLDITSLAAEPWFIPDTATLLEQLQAFRARREHFAVVVDEYGALMGIVTLEDILEEIVGEIADEHDQPIQGVRKQADGTLLVNGTVAIRDVNREFEWDLPDDNAATIAGLILHEARKIPDVGQTYTFYGFRFDIIRRQRNQIMQVRIMPPTKSSTEQ